MADQTNLGFISYRRSDSGAFTGRIYDRLVAALGREAVFRDRMDIPYGVDFVEYFQERLRSCRVFLAVVGRTWTSTTDDTGQRRLDAPDDFVRLELETALAGAGREVEPTVNGARPPTRAELPVSLAAFALRNGFEVRDDPDFDHDIARLLDFIREHLPQGTGEGAGREPGVSSSGAPPARPRFRKRFVLLPVLGVLLVSLIAAAALVLGVLRWALNDDDADVLVKLDGLGSSSYAPEVFLDDQPLEPYDRGAWFAWAVPKGQHTLYLTFPLCDPIVRTIDVEPIGRDSYREFPVSLFTTCSLGGVDFVLVPATTYTSGYPIGERESSRGSLQGEGGEPAPRQRVVVTQPLLVQQAELSLRDYLRLMGSEKESTEACELLATDYAVPAHCLTFAEAVVLANRWSEQEGLEPCYQVSSTDVTWEKGVECAGYRLPTEAEWEYFASLSTDPEHYLWRSPSPYAGGRTPHDFAWFDFNSGLRPQPGRGKQPSDLGLYDLNGNVEEWVWDRFSDEPGGDEVLIDPTGPAEGSARVAKGGSWASLAPDVRTVSRRRAPADVPSQRVGVRLVRSLAGVQQP
jgi:formylglycine-generating enzyme required for sulfatase activity